MAWSNILASNKELEPDFERAYVVVGTAEGLAIRSRQ